jgi:hypothetical protein
MKIGTKDFNKAFVIVPSALGRFQRPTILALSGANLKGIIYVSVDINYC